MNRAFRAALGITLFLLYASAHAQTASAKSRQSKSSQSKSSQSKSSPSKSSKGAPVKTGAARHNLSARSRRLAPRPSYQLHPDPERYQQIQQALADRGYFKGQVNGQWEDDSVDALKRFQADQKLADDGKISALTLSDLGLGPKHNGGSVTPPASASSNPAATPHADPSQVQTPPPAAPASEIPSSNTTAPPR